MFGNTPTEYRITVNRDTEHKTLDIDCTELMKGRRVQFMSFTNINDKQTEEVKALFIKMLKI